MPPRPLCRKSNTEITRCIQVATVLVATGAPRLDRAPGSHGAPPPRFTAHGAMGPLPPPAPQGRPSLLPPSLASSSTVTTAAASTSATLAPARPFVPPSPASVMAAANASAAAATGAAVSSLQQAAPASSDRHVAAAAVFRLPPPPPPPAKPTHLAAQPIPSNAPPPLRPRPASQVHQSPAPQPPQPIPRPSALKHASMPPASASASLAPSPASLRDLPSPMSMEQRRQVLISLTKRLSGPDPDNAAPMSPSSSPPPTEPLLARSSGVRSTSPGADSSAVSSTSPTHPSVATAGLHLRSTFPRPTSSDGLASLLNAAEPIDPDPGIGPLPNSNDPAPHKESPRSTGSSLVASPESSPVRLPTRSPAARAAGQAAVQFNASSSASGGAGGGPQRGHSFSFGGGAARAGRVDPPTPKGKLRRENSLTSNASSSGSSSSSQQRVYGIPYRKPTDSRSVSSAGDPRQQSDSPRDVPRPLRAPPARPVKHMSAQYPPRPHQNSSSSSSFPAPANSSSRRATLVGLPPSSAQPGGASLSHSHPDSVVVLSAAAAAPPQHPQQPPPPVSRRPSRAPAPPRNRLSTAAHPAAPQMMINNPRTATVRRNWVSHVVGNFGSISRSSKVLLILNCMMIIAEIISSSFVLVVARGEICDRPLVLYLTVYVIREAFCLPLVVYQYLHPITDRPRPNIHLDRLTSKWVDGFKWVLDAFGLLWFVAGNWWVFTSVSCAKTSPTVYFMCLILVMLGYVFLMIPIILCGGIVFCLPCVLVCTRALRGGRHGDAAGDDADDGGLGAPAHVIGRLPVVRFRRAGGPRNKKRHSGYSDPMLAAVPVADGSAIAAAGPATADSIALRKPAAPVAAAGAYGLSSASAYASSTTSLGAVPAFPVASASGVAAAPDTLAGHPLFRRRPSVAGSGSGALTTSSPEKHPASSGFEPVTLVAVVDASTTTATTSLSSSSSSSSSSSTLSPERPPPAASGPAADDPAASPTAGAGPPRLPRRPVPAALLAASSSSAAAAAASQSAPASPAHPALESLRTAAPRADSRASMGSAHSASSASAASAVSASFHAPPSPRAPTAPPRPLPPQASVAAYPPGLAAPHAPPLPPSVADLARASSSASSSSSSYSASSSSAAAAAAAAAAGGPPPATRRPLKPDTGTAASAAPDLELDDEDAVCVICLNQYDDGELLRRLHCNHHFHMKCVDEWLRLNKTCPLCVRDVTLAAGPDDPGAIV
ncbi:hypothetical protein HK405_007681 [Cladochytrium tenue]|nr:hypothetical protein HK405_007681 [Cladochytrium tenue]